MKLVGNRIKFMLESSVLFNGLQQICLQERWTFVKLIGSRVSVKYAFMCGTYL